MFTNTATKQKVMGIDLALKLYKSVRNDNTNFNYTAECKNVIITCVEADSRRNVMNATRKQGNSLDKQVQV